jgi:predicted P-loop ATPase
MQIIEIEDAIQFSLMKDIRQPDKLDCISLKELLLLLQDNRLRTETIRFRSFITQLDLKNEVDKKMYSKEKSDRFWAITPCGVFMDRREKENLIFYTKIVHMDFDNITDLQKDTILKYVKEQNDELTKSVLFAFTSPSNNGLKIFHAVKYNNLTDSIDELQNVHEGIFKAIKEMYVNKGFFDTVEQVDSKIYDLARSCYLCYDENLFINTEFLALETTNVVSKIKAVEVEKIEIQNIYQSYADNCKKLSISNEDKIAQLDNIYRWLVKHKESITKSYHNWYRVIFALKKELSAELALQYAKRFSQLDKTYDEKEFLKKFNQANYNIGKSPSLKSIVYLAEELGYTYKKTDSNLEYHAINETENFFRKLAEARFKARYNQMYCSLEICDIEKKVWKRFSDDEHLLPLLVDVLRRKENEKKEVNAKLITYAPKFSPVESLVNALPEWDKVDRFVELINALNLEKEVDKKWADIFFKLWLTGFWHGLLTDGYNENMIILQGLGGLGKTRFVNRLFSIIKLAGLNMDDYYTVKNVDAGNKDHLLEMTTKFVILNDELESLTVKKDNLDALKAMMSATNFSLRQIYKMNNTSFKRYASLFGTINNQHFLKDPTGNRRFWVLPIVNKIDHEFNIDLLQLFAQTLQMFKDGHRHYLSDVEKAELDEYQTQFESLSMEEDFILKHVIPDPLSDLSASDIFIQVSREESIFASKSIQQFGRLLHKHFAQYYFTKSAGQTPRRGYHVRVVFDSNQATLASPNHVTNLPTSSLTRPLLKSFM